MDLIELVLQNFFSFILIISLIVFIHEFGHFYVARLCGVKIEEFALGFGKELFGFNDKKGTRWKFCLVPLGGYVRMYGDKNGASIPDLEQIKDMSEAEKKQSFIFKNVYQRIAIVAAGPIANFLLAITIFTFLFQVNGVVKILPIISEVIEKSPAYEAGLKKGDRITALNGQEIKDFEEIREIVSQNSDKELLVKINRNNEIIDFTVTPKVKVTKDLFGNEIKIAMLGVSSTEISHHNLNLSESFIEANKETYRVSIAIFKAIGELITGKKSVEELGGPIKIAQYTGKTVEMGILAVLWFMAMISVNLGVMNLLPVPVLDGGHLFYYLCEVIFRKPLPQKVQQIGFQLGFSLVLALMLFTTFNDIRGLFN